MAKKFETNYGYFTENGEEYIITNPFTPRPWVNVISNGDYGLVVSQMNGGFSWITHSNLNRLTRWNQDLIRDDWGKYIYVRDESTGEFWSPTVQPVGNSVENYSCRHGMGYTIFYSEYKKIGIENRIFVPFGDNLEIWTVLLMNHDAVPRKISVFTYFEWCLGAAPDHHREFHRSFLESEFDEAHQIFLAKKRLWEMPSSRGHWNVEWPNVAFFACSEAVDGFEGDKEAFLGRYGSLSHPQAIRKGILSGTVGKWNDSICSLKKTIDLAPGEQKKLNFFLGAQKNESAIWDVVKKYRKPEVVEQVFSDVRSTWQSILESTQIQTPDDAVNFLTNKWLKYQAISGRIWGRAAYYQQSGAYGFRDQLQDSLIFLYSQPEGTRDQIFLHARHQFQDGRVLHWWHPLSDQGLDGGMSDDLLWLPFVTIFYLKETGDWSVLNESIPFYDNPQPAPLQEHLIRAIDKVLERFSERGLPLILRGDWNDGLSAVGLQGKGESVWLAHFLYFILQEFQVILRKLRQDEKASRYAERAQELYRAINDLGWDGGWFWRASKDNGERIGSARNEEGRIFLNAQSWAIIAQSTWGERQEKALQAVEEHLESEVGPVLLTPAYSKPDPDIGYLSRYAPGVRENGGVYTHAATWAVWAAALVKKPELAWRFYRKINPIYNGMEPERYYAEPYVAPGNIDGKDSPLCGRGGWSWYTGSAAWMCRVMLDFIVGIRADYEGLLVQPCLPKNWNEVRCKRFFRGVTYHVLITRSLAEGEETKIWVEDEMISGNIIPPRQDVSEVNVKVCIGK
ncbi:MAG: glycosyl transferase [Calditrichia bacterium]